MEENNKKQVNSPKKMKLKTAKRLKIVAVIFVILLLVIIGAAQIGGITFSTVGDKISLAFSELRSGTGYPYSINGAEVLDVGMSNSDLIILYDDRVKILNSTAKEVSSISHKFDHPVINSNSGRILVYDAGGKEFFVQSKTRVLYEKKLDNIILTGAMGRDGSVAIASRADGAESMLTVYDSHRKECFKWQCSQEHIISCDVSDNGKSFAVSVMGTKNGSIYSKVYIFNIKKSEPVASFEYEDSAVSTVKFLSNETLIIMGNNVCEIINGNEVKEKIDVSINTPYKLHISDNNIAILVLSKYSSTTQKIINVYDKAGNQMFVKEIDGFVKSVATDGKYISVLTDSNVTIYDRKGEVTGKASVNSDCEEVIVSGRNTYVYSLEEIERYNSIGDNEEEKK